MIKRRDDGRLVIGPGHKIDDGRHDFPTAKGDFPVWKRGTLDDLEVACYNCDWTGTMSDLETTYVPIGHGRWTRSGCPECERSFVSNKNSCRRHEMADKHVLGMGADLDELVEE